MHFSLATANIDSSEKRAEIINTWTAVPGVASTALQADLTDEINTSDPKAANRRREALSAILSIKPLSSIDWLSLSGVQLVTDQPMEQVLESLKLSTLTGPNEGYVMAERGIFGVSLWENLSPDLKSRVAIDLVPMMSPRTPAEGAEAGNFRPFFPQNPSGCGTSYERPFSPPGFRRKRSNNGWDFSFAASKVSSRRACTAAGVVSLRVRVHAG